MRAPLVARCALLLALVAACGGEDGSVANTSTESTAVTTLPDAPGTSAVAVRVERSVTFPFGEEQLHGVLTLPTRDGIFPAVVLVAGSEGPTGQRDGVSARSFIDHSRRMAEAGFAVLRYDPPGVGGSTGEPGFPSLDRRADETAAALDFLRSSPQIAADRVGLLGVSQGGWVVSMTAARRPDDVAFVISVVGSGQSVAKQQVYGIEAQSRAAGLTDDDVAKAVLFGRLLIDWQLTDPIFHDANVADARALGDGPWSSLMTLVYGADDVAPVESLSAGIEIMKSVQDEPWADALYLRELYIPRFESIPADITNEQLIAIQGAAEQSLLVDPKDFMTMVEAPVLAFFGEDDVNVDSEVSAALYRRYLAEAGNDDVTIVVIPDAGHNINIATPGYWAPLSEWLDRR